MTTEERKDRLDRQLKQSPEDRMFALEERVRKLEALREVHRSNWVCCCEADRIPGAFRLPLPERQTLSRLRKRGILMSDFTFNATLAEPDLIEKAGTRKSPT